MLVATRGIYETRPECLDVSWPDFCTWFASCAPLEMVRREDVPLWSPGGFSPEGVADVHAGERTMLCLDYDGRAQEDFDRVRTLAAPFARLIHTSHSHGVKDGYRFRLVIPFDRPVPIESWSHVWAAAVQFFHTQPDTKCRNISRWYFLPASNPQAAPCWIESYDGAAISVDYLLSCNVSGVDARGKIKGELAQHELVSRAELGKLGKRLERKANPDIAALGRALIKALSGEKFAAEGYRNGITFQLAGEIAKAFPFGNADDIAETFALALDQQKEPTIEAFAGMLRRHQAEKQATAAEISKVRWLQREPETFDDPLNPTPVQPEPVVVSPDYPLIVQRDGFYWFRHRGSVNFSEMFAQRDARVALLRYMSESVQVVDPDGSLRELDQILAEYSHPMKDLVGDYLAQQTTYDLETKTLTLCTAPRRPLSARYHEPVDLWLRAMFGDGFTQAAQWIATLGHLDRPAPALYMWGPRNVGKGFLIAGLERLWNHAAVPLAETVGSFNPGLKATPLVFADEEIPQDLSLGWLRSFLTSRTRTINEKFKPQFTLKGYTRLAIAANNRNALSYSKAGELTGEDAAAIAERFLVLEVSELARDILNETDTNEWIRYDLIAEHALWLSQTIEIPKLGRWAVEGNGEALVGDLAGSRFNWFAKVLANYFGAVGIWEGHYAQGDRSSWSIRTEDGQLWVSDNVPVSDRQRDHDLARAISFFRKSNETKNFSIGSGQFLTYTPLDVGRAYAAIGSSISVETLITTVNGSTAERVAKVGRGMRVVR